MKTYEVRSTVGTAEGTLLGQFPVVHRGDECSVWKYAIQNGWQWHHDTDFMFGGFFRRDDGHCLYVTVLPGGIYKVF